MMDIGSAIVVDIAPTWHQSKEDAMSCIETDKCMLVLSCSLSSIGSDLDESPEAKWAKAPFQYLQAFAEYYRFVKNYFQYERIFISDLVLAQDVFRKIKCLLQSLPRDMKLLELLLQLLRIFSRTGN
jgi:hypothetical protein